GELMRVSAVRDLGREVWPIGAGIVLSAAYFRIDVFLVEFWSGTEAVGLYNAVFRLVEALRLFPAAVMAVVLPALCRAADIRPLIRAAAPVTLSATAIAAVLWLAADGVIPTIYQARFAAAVPAFRVLLLAFPLMSLNMALTHQLVGWDAQRAYAALCAAALAFNLALNARLIPAWSIDGAAWTTVATELCLTAGCAIALWTTQAPGPRPRSGGRFPNRCRQNHHDHPGTRHRAQRDLRLAVRLSPDARSAPLLAGRIGSIGAGDRRRLRRQRSAAADDRVPRRLLLSR